MKRFQVIRTHTSAYQSRDFLEREKSMVLDFPLLTYEKLNNFKDLKTILITNTHTELSKLPPDLLKETVLIIHPNSGYDHFESDSALLKNIPLVVGHSIRAQAVAEYTLGAVFQGFLELPQHLTWNADRNWKRTLLKGKSVWIFGYGHIGKIVADTLYVLGMDVTVVDPYIKNCPHRLLKKWQDGDSGQADVVIAATSLNSSSHHLFNQNFFENLGDKVLFINGARGKLLDEKALRSYLLAHPESLAFLDVFENEPFDSDWHGFPQVWKTSHIAGVYENLDDKILDFEKNILRDYLDNPDGFEKKYAKELLQNKWIKGVLI